MVDTIQDGDVAQFADFDNRYTCRSAANPPRYAPVTAADYVQTLIRQSNRSGRPGVSARTAERMKS